MTWNFKRPSPAEDEAGAYRAGVENLGKRASPGQGGHMPLGAGRCQEGVGEVPEDKVRAKVMLGGRF